MEFKIKKNGTLPVLKMQIVDDGRTQDDSFVNFIEKSTIYFSMVDVDTGSYKIHMSPAGFVEKTFEEPNAKTEYYIYFKFQKNDLSKVGRYQGEFVLKTENGTFVLPIRENLFINVFESDTGDEIEQTLNLTLESTISPGSTIIKYKLSANVSPIYDINVNFTHILEKITGSSVVITTGITLSSSQLESIKIITLNDVDYYNLTQISSFSGVTISPIGLSQTVKISERVKFVNPLPTPTLTPTPTPTPSQIPEQVITDAIITNNVEYINVGNGLYLKFIDPIIVEDAILTDDEDYISVGNSLYLKYINPTPQPTPNQTPTPTPSTTYSQTPTPTNTPTRTPTQTITPSQIPLVPLTLYIQPLSGGQAIIFDGVTYTSETTVNIVKNTSYNIEAVPTPGFQFVGWNIFGGSFSSTGQSTTVSVSLDSGANLAPSYAVDPNFDALQYQLTTSLSSYQNATDNDWVIITQQEYNNIFGNVDGVVKIGNSDEQVNTRDVATGYDTTTFGTVDANTPLTIPSGYYVVGFVAESWNQNGQVQLGYTTTFHEGAPTYMGNSPNVIGGMTMFYVRKRPSNVEGAPASTNLYPVLNFLPPAYPNAVLNTFGWYTLDNGANWAETVSAFQTAKIQILLTNIKSWPSAPLPSPSQTPTPTVTPTPTPAPLTPFISIWSADPTVELPYSPTGTYTGTIDWGDGSVSANTFENSTHTYETSGDYTITITGQIEGWDFLNYGTSYKIKEITQWGSLKGEGNSNANMFNGCSSLVLTGVTDTPYLVGITATTSMFMSCGSITTINNLNSWNVSNIIDMSDMFRQTDNFNQDISNWDVSKVTNMSGMFQSAPAFNQNIGSWNVSEVTNMSSMFASATNFNQPLSGWNVSNVTNMYYMFDTANNFNQNIGSWNVSNVTDMTSMFRMTLFNQNISNWNVSNVSAMDSMFQMAINFNQDLSNWCLPLIPSQPIAFDSIAMSWSLPRPNWNNRTIVVNTLWNGGTSINTNLLQLNQTEQTLRIQVGDTITDILSATSIVGLVTSDGTYTYVGTGPGGTIAFDCQFPLTFTGPC